MPAYGQTGSIRKPPVGAVLDPRHPLVSDSLLRLFYPFNAPSGTQATDVAYGLSLTTPNTWTGLGSMAALKLTTSGSGAIATIPTALQLNYPWSVACGFRFNAAPSGDVALFALMTSNSNARAATVEINNLDKVFAGWVGNTGTAYTITTGSDYVVSASINKSTYNLYVNGAAAENGSTSISNPSWGATSSAMIGSPAGSVFASRTPNIYVYWTAAWNSYLTAAQHMQIGSHVNAIWQIFRPAVAWEVMQSVATGGSPYPGLVPGVLFGRRPPIAGPLVTTIYG
jgi:hypothetical protein